MSLAVAALLTAACPYDHLLTSNRGIAISGPGGSGSGPDALGFTVQPSSATAGNIITPAIQVLVRDSLGLPDSAFASNITMRISVNPVGGRLSGTLSVAPVNGIALFGDLVIDASGAGYVLQATAPGATTASSNSFTIFSQYYPTAHVAVDYTATRPDSIQTSSKDRLHRWLRMLAWCTLLFARPHRLRMPRSLAPQCS